MIHTDAVDPAEYYPPEYTNWMNAVGVRFVLNGDDVPPTDGPISNGGADWIINSGFQIGQSAYILPGTSYAVFAQNTNPEMIVSKSMRASPTQYSDIWLQFEQLLTGTSIRTSIEAQYQWNIRMLLAGF